MHFHTIKFIFESVVSFFFISGVFVLIYRLHPILLANKILLNFPEAIPEGSARRRLGSPGLRAGYHFHTLISSNRKPPRIMQGCFNFDAFINSTVRHTCSIVFIGRMGSNDLSNSLYIQNYVDD